jgi:hypothetical protein
MKIKTHKITKKRKGIKTHKITKKRKGIKAHKKTKKRKGIKTHKKTKKRKGKDQKETVGFLYFLRFSPFFSATATCNSSLNFL